MATRETAAQKRTRISMLLADFDARNREANKLNAIVKGMREQIKELKAGTYGEWQLAFTPGRQIVDAAALNEIHAKLKIEVPMKSSAPSVVVVPVAGTGAKK